MTPEEESKIYKEAHDSYFEYRRRRALKAVFEKDSYGDIRSDYNSFKWGLLWIKLLICLIFKKTSGSYLDKNSICILAYDESGYPDGMSWEAVWISDKIFSGWQVCIGSDGT